MNIDEYKISNEEFEDMGFKDIKVPDPKDFGLKEDLKELEGVSNFEGYPFFAMDIESDGTPGFFDSSSYDVEDYGDDILD
tara:strand:+ start:355 stop:594 length:240 start_codon:yes stop_codon:yes gene_type:complete